ncbi:MAG: PPC domain-containing protein [Gemmataceae bacterium]|nr:PPC domain-containing protein [Gemmataceae bacterium]
MIRLKTVFGLSLCVLCVLCGELVSAPPTLTSLFPAGGAVGQTVEFTASGSFDKWPVTAWASDPNVALTPGKDKGKFTATIAPGAKPGPVWIRLHDASGASPLRPFVLGVLPEIAEAEPNDDVAKAQTVERSCVVNGKLGRSGDVDVFAIQLAKGQTLVASLLANHVLRSPMDAVLQVVSPDGFVLDQNHDHRGLDPQLAFTAPKDGAYRVRIFAFPSQPDSSIRHFGSDLCVYRLTLSTAGYEDIPIPLAIQNGSGAKPKATGWNLAIAPIVPSAVAVREEAFACHDFTAAKPTTALVPPFAVTGRIAEPGAVNAIPVKLTKSKPIAVQIESRALELPLTPVLRLLDESGAVLARAEPARPNADCELNYAPTKDQTATLEVRDLYRAGGERFIYRVRVVHPEPDADLTVAADRFALAPGTPLEIPVTVARKAGFKGVLELKAEGLPPDVTATSVPGKDDKTLTLKLSTEAKAISKPFRIVAVAKDNAAFTRPVRAALAEFETTTSDLWLTVGSDAKVAPPTPKKKK